MLKFAILSISMMMISAPAISGILPSIRDALGITQAQSELLLTLPSLATLVTVLMSSFITKKIGIKNTTLIGLILTGIGGIFPVFSANFILILISRAVFGLGLGLFKSLAVRYITLLFEPHERPKLMGYRSAFEQGGQVMLTVIAGLLFAISWNMSFLVYLLPLMLAVLFYFVVPDVKAEMKESNDQQEVSTNSEKMPFCVYPIVAFAVIIVLIGASIAIRFPAMSTEIMGDGYNSSNIVALKPVFGMLAGSVFGKLYQKIGKTLLYIGILGLAISASLVGFSNGNFIILVSGFLVGSIVPAWIMPFVMMTISKRTSGQNQTIAMSFVVAGIQGGVFLMTPTIRLLEIVTNNDSLTAGYPILAGMLIIVLIFIIALGPKIMKLPDVSI